MRALLLLLVGACSLSTSGGRSAYSTADGSEAADDGDVGEVQEALSPEATSRASEASTFLVDRLPRWSVRIAGEDYDGKSTHWRWSYPPSVDRAGTVVAVRAGEEANPTKRVVLELEQHWKHGDTYLEVLMKHHGLTMLDMVMIQRALAAASNRNPRALMQTGPTSCFECGPAGPIGPIGPIGGDDHTGPAPGAWGGPSRPVPRPPPSPGGRPKPDTRPVVHGRGPSTEEEQRTWMNGVRPGDPKPQSAPTDATYRPAPDEVKETFKCEGATYYGFKGGCVDFQVMSTTTKWALKLGLFVEKAAEAARSEVLHTLFHDGKGPECMADCDELAIGVGALGSGAVMALCLAATRGMALTPCLNGTSQVVAC